MGYSLSASGNVSPKNGKVIGYIIDGRYVEKVTKSCINGPYFLSYGSAALVKSVSEDLWSHLLKVFPPNEATSIISAASLRMIYPGVTDNRLSSRYEKNFISLYYPGAALSKNTMTSLETWIGQDPKKRKEFYKLRLQQVEADDHIAVDGLLKQDNSSVNDLSAFSFKGRAKGVKDISVIFAYDIERQELLAAEVLLEIRLMRETIPISLSEPESKRELLSLTRDFQSHVSKIC